jgi:hypothetical protein
MVQPVTEVALHTNAARTFKPHRNLMTQATKPHKPGPTVAALRKSYLSCHADCNHTRCLLLKVAAQDHTHHRQHCLQAQQKDISTARGKGSSTTAAENAELKYCQPTENATGRRTRAPTVILGVQHPTEPSTALSAGQNPASAQGEEVVQQQTTLRCCNSWTQAA